MGQNVSVATNPSPLVLGFAHRGARANAPENTLEAFVLARRMGATALETDVWITRDGVAVVDHDGVGTDSRRRTPIHDLECRQLAPHVPTLGQLLDAVGTNVDLSIDVKDAEAAAETLRVIERADQSMLRRTWLCHPDPTLLAEWRKCSPDVQLVASIKRRQLHLDHRRSPTALAQIGVDVVNLRGRTWSPSVVRRCHEAGLLAFAWDVQCPGRMRVLMSWGIDGIYSDHVDRLVRTVPPAHSFG